MVKLKVLESSDYAYGKRLCKTLSRGFTCAQRGAFKFKLSAQIAETNANYHIMENSLITVETDSFGPLIPLYLLLLSRRGNKNLEDIRVG